MKIEIKLKDSKSCNGCVLLNEEIMKCRYKGEYGLWITQIDSQPIVFIRPEQCIEENGL